MRAALALALLALAGAADAQRIWRCGPDGRVLQDRPCRDGDAIVVRDERPSAVDEAAAREVARRETALADQLREERLKREREAIASPGGFVEPEKPPVKSVLGKTSKKKPKKPKKKRAA